jgi:carboxylesterase type B
VTGNGTRTAFKGVPYARSPADELRMDPPMPLDDATTAINATSWGKMCMMDNATLFANNWVTARDMETGGTAQTSEDCLSLNVWGFTNTSANKPVIVFIHGGGMYSGSGSQYNGASLSEGADAVVVTFNYRLGVLGWLAADALSGNWNYAPQWNGAKGNWGLMDMHMVLQWVQDEISKFGGDPTRVTITGEEAGAWAVCSILSSTKFDGYYTGAEQNLTRPLYTTAILQDGGSCMGGEMTMTGANTVARQVARSVGQTCVDGEITRSCIEFYQNPENELWDNNRFLYSSPDNYSVGSTQLGLRVARPLTVVDGVSITQSAYTRLLAGELSGKNIVVGMNANASTFYSALEVNLGPMPSSPGSALPTTPAPTAYPVPVKDISVVLTESLTFSASEVLRLSEFYPDDGDKTQHWEALLTDVMSGCPAEGFLRAAAVRAMMDDLAGTPPPLVRGYYFNIALEGAERAVNLGAAHGVDTAYLFGDEVDTVGGAFMARTQYTFEWNAGATPTLNPVLVTEMQAQWGRIARGFYGAWPLYTTDAHAVIELNTGLSKHVSLIKAAINCNRCDAVLATIAFSVPTPDGNQSYAGAITQLASYTRPNSYTAAGTASMTLFRQGNVDRTRTVVSLTGTGLTGPFAAHLHSNPCSANGGSHYKNDTNGATDAVNENWPTVNCAGGVSCTGIATNDWQPRADSLASGLSIVIHDTPNSAGGNLGRPYLCADLVLTSAGTYDSEFLAAVPSAMRTDCLLDSGRECVFGDNQANGGAEDCDDDLLYDGGDMFWMWFGTVLMVLVFEVVGYLVYKNWEKIKAKLDEWQINKKCHTCWRPCCNKMPCCKPKDGPTMPKAMVLDNDNYADEDGKTADDHDTEKGTLKLEPRGSEVGLTSESTVDDYEEGEDYEDVEKKDLAGTVPADDSEEDAEQPQVDYNDDGQAAV